jgi:chorismate mutase
MTNAVRAIRGATTVDEDTASQISERTAELLLAMLDRNGVHTDDLISVVLTATPDIHAMFPATAAREIGLGAVPLLCASEIDVEGSMPLCIRVLAHLETPRSRDELHHIYLHGAKGLRDDLPD